MAEISAKKPCSADAEHEAQCRNDAPCESRDGKITVPDRVAVEPYALGLSSPFWQAPMAGFSNDAWRRILCKFGGIGLLATEMMHARGSLEMVRRRKTLHGRLFGLPTRSENTCEDHLREPEGAFCTKKDSRADFIPLSVQIWDNQPESLSEFAEKLIREYNIQILDLNFGCPAPDVVQKAHSGSWLLQFPEQMEELASAVVQASRRASMALGLPTPIPVTAKMRLGISEERLTYREAALALESAGVAAVTVHGRTTRQFYSGQANWDRIAEIKQLLHIPVIGNGDIRTAPQAVEFLHRYGVDGVMIGRAALNEPWIFRQAFALLSGVSESEALEPPAADFQKQLLLEHFEVLLEQHNETEAVMLMRKFAPCYGVGMKNARTFRIHVVQARSADEFREVVQNFFPTERIAVSSASAPCAK